MKMFSNPTTLEILPDEILLEVCEYLLCVDTLYSFFGLNARMARMISQYYHHVSLHKASITQSSYLCINVLPQIGSHIQSLLIDCCYSVLQNRLFIKHFGKNMSIMFPHLKKISLVAIRYKSFIAFLDTLHDLHNLVEIHLHELFEIDENNQTTVLRILLQANNNQLTSVLINNRSSCLKFNNTDCYANILKLRITMKTIKEIPSLFAAVPNVRYLDVLIEGDDSENVLFDEMKDGCLYYLINFQLRSAKHWWKFEELSIILDRLPNVQNVSLFLYTFDSRLVHGNIFLALLPLTIQQYHVAFCYVPGLSLDEDDTIVSSWPSSHPIRCFISDDCWFIHTLPWHFTHMSFPSSIGNRMIPQVNRESGYDKHVKELHVVIDNNLTFAKSLSIIGQCRRMRQLVIFVISDDGVDEEQYRPPCLPELSQLDQISICHSKLVDLNHLSSILIAAPNLLRLDLPADYLINLLEDQQMRDLLGQRIKSLSILNATELSHLKLNEEYIHLIASTLTSVYDVYVDLKHLTPSLTISSHEILPSSMESMIQYILCEFKQHKLISLVIDIQSSEILETDVKQWLQDNTILCQQEFDADLTEQLNRLIIWMG